MTLREHIDSLGVKPYVWADENGVQKDAVYRHLKGKPVSYDTSEAISNATGGNVPVMAIYRTGRSAA